MCVKSIHRNHQEKRIMFKRSSILSTHAKRAARASLATCLAGMLLSVYILTLVGQAPAHAQTNAWMDTSLPPAQRATLLVAAMTQAEKLAMVNGTGGSGTYSGMIPANTRLGIPA